MAGGVAPWDGQSAKSFSSFVMSAARSKSPLAATMKLPGWNQTL
jgi:hypothetical protein